MRRAAFFLASSRLRTARRSAFDRAGDGLRPGAFRFILDTGANRSVFSPQVAARLQLVPSAETSIGVHGVTGSAVALQQWLLQQRQKVPDGSATAKAIDYTLNRWRAFTRYLEDGELPIDNNWVENQIRPIAIGRSNWLFAGSSRAGQRAAAVMGLPHSARLNGHDPYAYLKDVLAH